MGCKTCEKPMVNYRKGLWSPDEDQRLTDYVLKHGHGCWSSVPAKAGLGRTGKSCRLRWINYLRPGLKRGMFSPEEEETIMKLHNALGNKWSQIAMHLTGRTDNDVKNYWNSYLKKRVNPRTHASSSNSQDSNYQIPHDLDNKISASESMEVLLGRSKVTPQASAFSKIIFADWISSADHVNGAMSCPWDSNQVFQPDGEFLHGFGDGSVYGGFQSQLQTEGQLQGGGLFDLWSLEEINLW